LNTKGFFKQHILLLIILPIHISLGLVYAGLTPLGEAPDEPAHLTYAQFIAQNGRLPATLGERGSAGYRSTWPPLYHLLVAAPLAWMGDAPPTRLKSVGDTPRRLIPTNGQTIASFIHTTAENWPWQGIVLAWHLSRLISVLLMAAAVCLTYAIAWRLTRRRQIAAGAAALHATIPQVLFIGAVVNDDNLLVVLSGLVLLIVTGYAQSKNFPSFTQLMMLGAMLGLATVAKYNALPLWAIVILWLIRQAWRKTTRPLIVSMKSLCALLIGAALTGGWWFIFVWRNFNQIETLGFVRGSLAALAAGTADASLRQLGDSATLTFPTPEAWLEWAVVFFKSFWGLFGGGSTIELPAWIYWLLALLSVISACSLAIHTLRTRHYPFPSLFPLPSSLLIPLFFLPLPIIRFIASGSIVETAQGRHLFPALPAITLGLTLGLFYFTHYALRITQQAARTIPQYAVLIPPLFTLLLSLYSLNLIRASYPPPIPLYTTEVITDKQRQHSLLDSMTLLDYRIGQVANGALPVTLFWQANAIPPEDYLFQLVLTDKTGHPAGSWLGHPIGGRYPTRAWDKGDILRDDILILLLPGLPPTKSTLTLTLFDESDNAVTPPLTLADNLSISQAPNLPEDTRMGAISQSPNLPISPFTYRSTLSFVLPGPPTPPQLIAPDGQIFTPTRFISHTNSSLAHFIVAASWPSGEYQLSMNNEQLSITNYQLSITNYQLPITIRNRSRQFAPPPMQHIVEANFAGQITLLGYDLPQNRVQPGQSFPITLYLQAERTMGQDFIIFNHLLDQNATQRGGADRIPQNYYTTLLWVPQEIVTDSYPVSVDPDAPPGIYRLDVGLYPADQPERSLPLLVDGQPIERNSVTIGPIKVGGPPPDVATTQAHPQTPTNITFGNQISLLGFDLTDQNGQPIQNSKLKTQNSKLKTQNSKLTLYWQATAIPPADYTVFVHLIDSQGNLVAQADSPPAAGAYPTHLWDAGEIIIDDHPLPDFAPGRYSLQVGLYRPDTGERLPVAGSSDGAVTLAKFEVEP
jgi:hypothetical protein